MKPFRSVVDKIKWSEDEKVSEYAIGYFDRIENKILEMPLSDFLNSDIPEHKARHVKKNGIII